MCRLQLFVWPDWQNVLLPCIHMLWSVKFDESYNKKNKMNRDSILFFFIDFSVWAYFIYYIDCILFNGI